jgi:hypothetical protein
MNPQEQAQHYYKTAFDRWALELSYEKNHLIAKSIAIYLVEELLAYEHLEAGDHSWWEQVLEEINKIRGYDNNIHDGNHSTNSERRSTI